MLIMPKFVEKNRLNMPSTRIRQEQEIVAQMVRIYCRQKEKHTDLCPDCKELLQYAHAVSLSFRREENNMPVMPCSLLQTR